MKHTTANNHGLVYRYYTCYNHLKYRTCKSPYKNIPADPIERSVIDEVLKIIKSPEIVIHINALAEHHNEIKRDDLMMALKNLHEVWNYLYPAELQKIVKMLLNCVDIKADGIKINLNLEGFDNLFVELAA